MDLTSMWAWMSANGDVVWTVAALSALAFVGTLVLIPVLVARIPTDYFAHHRRRHNYARDRHPAVHRLLVISKNVLGVLLFVVGAAMLVLPGQGILTMLIGLMLVDFPGKYTLEKRLARRPAVMHSLNWIRAKAHRPPLEPPQDGD